MQEARPLRCYVQGAVIFAFASALEVGGEPKGDGRQICSGAMEFMKRPCRRGRAALS